MAARAIGLYARRLWPRFDVMLSFIEAMIMRREIELAELRMLRIRMLFFDTVS